MLFVYFYTISSCFVIGKECTQGQEKELFEFCHNHPYARQTLVKTAPFWDLAFYRALVPAFSVSFNGELVLPRTVSWFRLTHSGSAIHCDCEVWTWNFIYMVNARFVVRWMLTCDVRKSVKAVKGEEKSAERGNRAPGKSHWAQGKLKRWLIVVPGVPICAVHIAFCSTTNIRS